MANNRGFLGYCILGTEKGERGAGSEGCEDLRGPDRITYEVGMTMSNARPPRVLE